MRSRGLAAVALALTCGLAGAAAYPPPRPATAGKGRLELLHGIPVLHLAGTPAEMGQQQGTLLGEQFRVLRQWYLKRFLGQGAQLEAAKLAAMGFQRFMPADMLAELKAIASASGEAYVNLLLANTFLDTSRAAFCSVVIARGQATRGGRVLFARNNDFPTLGIAHKASLLVVYHHAGRERHSFVSVGWPGMVGVISGMNDAGLCAATLVSLSQRGVQPGMPYCLMYREILETCATPQEALARVKRTKRTSANNLAVAGPRGEPLVIEFTPRRVVARRPTRGVLLATNHFRSPAHTAAPKPIDGRFATLQRLVAQHRGRIDVSALKDMLHAVHQGKITLQAMVFEPAERRLHLAIGALPATSGKYVTIDCARLLAAR